jgi:DNA-binding IclR family transcriptional regulator
MPLHSTSAGKVLLAALSDGEARKLLGSRKLAAITPHTVTDPSVLLATLPRVRRQGFATVNEENIPGVLSVGAPIRDRAGAVVAALSVAFPKYLDSGLTLGSVEPLVTGAALRVSRTLGMPPAMLLTGNLGSVSGGTQ